MHFLKELFFVFILCSYSAICLTAQSTITYNFKKGEVFDLTFFLEKKNINKDSLFGIYREVLFPIGMEYSFQPMKGFSIKETLRGGFQPEALIFGKWASLKQRIDFLTEVVKRVPAFHDMRRGLWTTFDATFYEMKNATSFTVNKEAYNTVTAYWMTEDEKASSDFIKKWKDYCQSKGGKVIIELREGISPVGFYYNPDYLLIIEWPNQKAYEQFMEKVEKMDASCVLNINEFCI